MKYFTAFVGLWIGLLCIGSTYGYNENDFFDVLIERSNHIIAQAKYRLPYYENKMNVFAKTVKDSAKQLTILSEQFDEMRNTSERLNSSDIFVLELPMAQQIFIEQNQLARLFKVAKQYGQYSHTEYFPSEYYLSLRKTLDGAYEFIGHLVVLNKRPMAMTLENEVKRIEELLTQLHSVQSDFHKVQDIVGQLVEHEELMNSEMYRIAAKFMASDDPNDVHFHN